MRHQARILPDGFECSCGCSPRYRRDADPAQIRADLERHQNKVRPTKEQISKLINDFQEWDKKIDKATTWHPGEPMVMREVPNPPQDFLDRTKEIVVAFEWVRFPVLEELLRDPGEPHIRDVVHDLAQARNLGS